MSGAVAPAGVPVTVNGAAGQREGDRFAAEVVLRDKETDLVAVGEDGAGRHEARVARRLGPVLRAALPLLDRRQQLLPPRHLPEGLRVRCSTAST